MRSTHKQTMGTPNPARRMLMLGLMTTLLTSQLFAQSTQGVPDVTAMSIEDLMNMEVTSVSKHTQKVGDAPAAIFVITQEDIRRSGAASIPEALRMVPGVEVARIDENKWAIGSRGFNGRFDNKLLVLIDGRTVYTPLFSGVYWNVQDVMLEDVDRIEVIRGPGATMWGANAVNGVINIITKSAKATQGGIATAEGGTEERTAESARYGGKIDVGNGIYYRAYAKYFDWEPSEGLAHQPGNDGWDAERGGFRTDFSPTKADSLTVQGDIYKSNFDETLTSPVLAPPFYSSTYANGGDYAGGNLLSRWNHSFAHSTTSLQFYFDDSNIEDNTLFTDHEGVYDLDFQHNLHLGEHQNVVWGLGYRSISDTNGSSFIVALQPNHSWLNQYSSFVQDELSLLDNRMSITFGSKFEHNPYTGFEVEPNIRVLGTIAKNQSVWAAVSRAVRTPALTEQGLRLDEGIVPPNTPPINSPLPAIESIFGSNLFGSEDMLAYEIGYRVQATNNVSLDIAAFYNDYMNLRSAEPGAPIVEGTAGGPTDVVIPFIASNKMSGGTYGIEPFIEWRVRPIWKLVGSYSYLQMDIHKNADSLDPTTDNPDGQSPRNQFYIRSSTDLPKHWEQDIVFRYVDPLPTLGIPSYFSLDARIGYKPIAPLELSIGGEDLLNSRHIEFLPEFINTLPTVVRRTFSARISYRF